MTWVKQLNDKYKPGRYVETRHGFRIYRTKLRQRHGYIEIRLDGKYAVTVFIPGEVVAINKEGLRFRRTSILEILEDIHLYHNLDVVPLNVEQEIFIPCTKPI